VAIPTSTVSGRIALPDDTVRTGSHVTFTLSGVDADGDVVTPVAINAPMDGTGNISVELWPNSRGLQRTKYRAIAHVRGGVGKPWRDIDLGNIVVPEADANIADLIGIRIPAEATNSYSAFQGETINLALRFLNENNAPRSLEGITITSWIILGAGPAVDMVYTLIDEAEGTFELALSDTVTASLPPGGYDWWVKLDSGDRVAIKTGQIKIIGVTA